MFITGFVLVQLYQEQFRNPPIGYNMPSMSGKILWVRQLLNHIEKPMSLLQKRPAVLMSPAGKATVKKYNRTALKLTEYEILHYQNWLKLVELANESLQVYTFLDYVA